MTAGEMINKLGEVPAETPVEFLHDGDEHPDYLTGINSCEYDEENDVVVLS